MSEAISIAQKLYPEVVFQPGRSFAWDARHGTVTFPELFDGEHKFFLHGLAHEISHALLEHTSFKHDVDLLKMERDAWTKTKDVLEVFKIDFDRDHVDDCMDTYRDWLYARSKCPQCELVSIQSDNHHYYCPHCRITWKVPSSRLCAVKRKVIA